MTIFDQIANQVLTNQQDTCGKTDNSTGIPCFLHFTHKGRHEGFRGDKNSAHLVTWPNKSDLSDAQKIELLRDALKALIDSAKAAATTMTSEIPWNAEKSLRLGIRDARKALELTEAK